MKKMNFFKIAGIASLLSANTLFAQEAVPNYTHNTQHPEEAAFLVDFDEAALIAELKAKGIQEIEFRSIIRHKKIEFINAKKGIVQETSTFFSQQRKSMGPCDNAGFEDGTFLNWTGATGQCDFLPTTWAPGFVTTRHTIVSGAGFDALAINTVTSVPEIPLIAPGGLSFSARLGNDQIGAETEYLRYPITVTAANTSFTYQYAVVLENPTGHTAAEQPRFDITVYDASGTPVSGPCGVYSVEGLAAASDTTFHPFNDSFGSLQGYYKKWTTVSIDLTPYIGTTVTIQFQTSDCTLTGHFGYAYIDASCSQLAAQVAFCPDDTLLLLSAPGGFNTYQWYDASSAIIPGATNDTLAIINPILGQVYSVSMLSASGCGTSLTVTLAYSEISVGANVINATCHDYTDGYAYVTPGGAIPPFTYVWVDSTTGLTVGGNNDSLVGFAPGTYFITVSSLGGCSTTDTLTIANPPNPGDTLGIGTVFCPGDPTINLYAPAGYASYEWYTNPDGTGPLLGTGDSLFLVNPIAGTQFTVVMYPVTGCPVYLTTLLNYSPPPSLPDYIVKTNVFTPDGDFENPTFDFNKFAFVKEFHIEVYDRWGKKVFETNDLTDKWDGKVNGKDATEGVYFWLAHYTSACVVDAQPIENKGFVHLLRKN